MSKTAEKDFFAQTPGFLAVIEEITARGFFTKVSANVDGYDGIIYAISINGEGLIPDHISDMKMGVMALVNIKDVIAQTSTLVNSGDLKLTSCVFECNTKNWDKWNRSGQSITGSKGKRTTFTFVLSFDTKSQRRRKRQKHDSKS